MFPCPSSSSWPSLIIAVLSPPSLSCFWLLPSPGSSSSPSPASPSLSPSSTPLRGNSTPPQVVREAVVWGRGASGIRCKLVGWNRQTAARWECGPCCPVVLRLNRGHRGRFLFVALPTHLVRLRGLLRFQTIPDISGMSGSRWQSQPTDDFLWA